MLDFLAADHAALRSRESPWLRMADDLRTADAAELHECGVLIVGGGITGSLAAEHLTARGHSVCVLDRQRPGLGSTAASTAMLQWEIDASLGELSERYGADRAASIYRRSLKAVEGLADLTRMLDIPCDFVARSTLYLAEGAGDPSVLRAEHLMRRARGLPGRFLEREELLARFGIDRPAAILSPGAAEADPLRLAQGLLMKARQRGASVTAGEAVKFEPLGGSVNVRLADGRAIRAGCVVLATGYVMPDFVPGHLHSVTASWALKTAPQPPEAHWPGRALIWEDSEHYVYARSAADGSIIIGGEDEPVVEPHAREALAEAKTAALQEKLAMLRPHAVTEPVTTWSGVFGETEDGLPLIGPVPGMPKIFAAFGYGGNGITFSYMASRIIAELIEGGDRAWFRDFSLERTA